MDDLSLINHALNEIGQQSLTSLDDTRNSADVQSAILQLDRIKRSVLRAKDWNCARRRKELTPIGTDSTDNGSLGEWARAYRLPPDCLAARRWISRFQAVAHAKFSVEVDDEDKRIIYTDLGNGKLVYTGNMTDVNRWDALLYDACSTRLSVVFATAIVRDYKLSLSQMDLYKTKLDEAIGVDESEGEFGSVFGRDLVSVRHSS